VIHARLDLSKSRSTAVGSFHGCEGPQIWFCAEGVTVPDEPGPIEPGTENEESLLLCLTLSDAAALSTLLDQSVLACINLRGRAN
jgi:hypothetical protein